MRTTLLAVAFALGFGAAAGSKPADAAIVTYDLVFGDFPSVSASGQFSFDTSLLNGDASCEFGAGCGFTDFSATFVFDAATFNFTAADVGYMVLTLNDGLPVALEGATFWVSSGLNGASL